MGKKFIVVLTMVFVAFFAAGTAWADGVSINNASFESSSPLTTPCGYSNCFYNYSITGWNVTNGGTWQPGSTLFPSMPDGSLGAFTNHGSISQTLSATILPNTSYTLDVFVGNRGDGVNGTYTLSLDAILNGVLTTLCSTPVLNANSITAHTYQSEGCTYTSGSSVPAGNFFLVFTSTYGQLDVDNVSLNYQNASTVPESSSVLLLGIGMLLMLGLHLGTRQRTITDNA